MGSRTVRTEVMKKDASAVVTTLFCAALNRSVSPFTRSVMVLRIVRTRATKTTAHAQVFGLLRSYQPLPMLIFN